MLMDIKVNQGEVTLNKNLSLSQIRWQKDAEVTKLEKELRKINHIGLGEPTFSKRISRKDSEIEIKSYPNSNLKFDRSGKDVGEKSYGLLFGTLYIPKGTHFFFKQAMGCRICLEAIQVSFFGYD
jgi:hypothetical protein